MAETLVWREKVHSAMCQSAIAQSNRSTGQSSSLLWSKTGQRRGV